ncbi:hypothetical protein O165_018515 [Pseudomonas soli]|nr:hypothetical protein O165_018515 [Pseudomonas soli]
MEAPKIIARSEKFESPSGTKIQKEVDQMVGFFYGRILVVTQPDALRVDSTQRMDQQTGVHSVRRME